MRATESKTAAPAVADPRAAKDQPAKAEVKDDTPKEETPDKPQTRVSGQCVVKEDFHVGRAVNGKVCSYHAMHYRADGTAR